jgi:N-acetylglucosamine kinase-like BadF-type ATPase
VSRGVALAVDGGAFKTHLALVRADGSLMALVRGGHSSPHLVGIDGCVGLLERLLGEAATAAGLERDGGAVAEVAQVLMAGADLPAEEEALEAAMADRGWAERLTVANDTFAVLRAGTERGWGVALVCGAGINCVGVAPDGRQARFPSLGTISGDWGGGGDVGLAGLAAAARSEDGRGPRTGLEGAVADHFGLPTPRSVAEAIHLGEIPRRRIAELAPIVLRLAGEDPVAAEIADRLASEGAALIRVALERLDLVRAPTDVVLGGGLLRGAGGAVVDGIAERLGELAPAAAVRLAEAPPIAGATLLALDELGSGPAAGERARRELSAAVAREPRG